MSLILASSKIRNRDQKFLMQNTELECFAKLEVKSNRRTCIARKIPFLGISDLSSMMAASSQAHACIFLYESLPFSVSLSQGFGFDSSSDTVPCERPRTYLANNLCPILWTESNSLTLRLMCSVSRLVLAYLSMLYLSISCSRASMGSPLGMRESPSRPTRAPGGSGPMSSAKR